MEPKKKMSGKMSINLTMIGMGILAGVGFGILAPVDDIKFLPLMLLFLLSMYLQMIVHELGHLIGGLLSGYKFSSFRVGSAMIIKDQGKLAFRRLKLAGTGGQCLMKVPDMDENGNYPFALYNLGGSIINALTGVICIGVYLATEPGPLLGSFLAIFGILGILYAIVNGVPLENGLVANDGYNTKMLKENDKARRAFWIQIKVNEMISDGYTLPEMPEEWFEMPSEEDMQNPMIASLAVFRCNRLLNEMRVNQAYKEMNEILSKENGVLGIYRNLLKVDCIYCEIVTQGRAYVLDEYLDTELKKFVNSMRRFPSVIRMAYTHTILMEENEEKAKVIRDRFEEICMNYPQQSELRVERRLMDYALYLFNEKNKG